MMGANRKVTLSVAALLCGMSSRGLASSANCQHYQLGERGAGMGGAVCSLADGIDATWYNPAGLAWTKRDSLSLSANLYGFQRYSADDALAYNEALSTESFQSIPTTMSGTYRSSSNLVLGFSALVPRKFSYFESLVFEEQQHYYTLSSDAQSLWIGPSAGWRLSEKWSVGLSIYGVYETYNQFVNAYYNREGISYSREIKYWNFGALAQIGVQYRPAGFWKAGLLLQTPAAPISGHGEWLESLVNSQASEGSRSDVLYAKDLDSSLSIPARITAGVGWEKPDAWAWGVDVTYHAPTTETFLNGTGSEGQELDAHVHMKQVVDVNAGVEYTFSKRYPLRLGAFTSQSAAPDQASEDEIEQAHIDLYGLTGTIGVRTKNTAANIGLNYLFGSGLDYGWELKDGKQYRTSISAREQHLYAIVNTCYFF